MTKPILLSTPHMGDREHQFVTEAFETNWIAPIGPHVNAFEQEFCQVVGSSHAAAVSSGTAALHLALKLVGVGVGDEVFCSTLTFSASANPIAYLGATPVFIPNCSKQHSLNVPKLANCLKQWCWCIYTGKVPISIQFSKLAKNMACR
jgi:dTDP-4-amino-4,6-dideoxygalactose transaminase